MFATTGASCTFSLRKSRYFLHEGACPRRATAVATPAAKTACSDGPSGSNPSRMNTYAKRAANPCRMCTYKIIGLKVPWNEHLQKNRGAGGLIVTQPLPREGVESPAGALDVARQAFICDNRPMLAEPAATRTTAD